MRGLHCGLLPQLGFFVEHNAPSPLAVRLRCGGGIAGLHTAVCRLASHPLAGPQAEQMHPSCDCPPPQVMWPSPSTPLLWRWLGTAPPLRPGPLRTRCVAAASALECSSASANGGGDERHRAAAARRWLQRRAAAAALAQRGSGNAAAHASGCTLHPTLHCPATPPRCLCPVSTTTGGPATAVPCHCLSLPHRPLLQRCLPRIPAPATAG